MSSSAAVRLRQVQLDVPADRYDATVAFWAGALGATARDVGGPYTRLVGAASPIGVHLQRLGDGTARIHLDLEADDPDAARARLVELGATAGAAGPCGPVLAGPAGLLLCVCTTAPAADELRSPSDGRVGLRLVVVDLPSDDFERGLRFWGEAFGVEARRFGPEFADYARLPDVPVAGGSFDMLGQDVGSDAARFHLDLHVADEADRDAEVARLEELGARPVGAVKHWITLEDPAGLLLCVVPDRHGGSV